MKRLIRATESTYRQGLEISFGLHKFFTQSKLNEFIFTLSNLISRLHRKFVKGKNLDVGHEMTRQFFVAWRSNISNKHCKSSSEIWKEQIIQLCNQNRATLIGERFSASMKVGRTITNTLCSPSRPDYNTQCPKCVKLLNIRVHRKLLVRRGECYIWTCRRAMYLLKNSVYMWHWPRILDRGFVEKKIFYCYLVHRRWLFRVK